MEKGELKGRKKLVFERKKLVIQASYRLFLKKKIEASSIQEIADEAGVGVASVYRYFSNKGEIAVETAIYSWETGFNPLLEEVLDQEGAGFEALMQGYLKIFRSNPGFFRYLEDFDNYINKLETPPEAIKRYETMLARQDEMIGEILEKDVNSLRDDVDRMTYLNMAGKAVMALAQKLVNRGHIVSLDESYDPEGTLRLLAETLYKYIIRD